ncbi:transposase [Bacilli bacterium PM5-9]|nr:transposase [Bacilli bacterium PM5-9]
MSYLFLDADSHKIIDIVDNRQLHNLEKYFNRYTKKARDSVKYIVIDMYKPYIVLIKKMFKNAKIIFDKFHIIQHINRALNKTRIDLMNKDKANYNKLKRYWKLLLTNRNKIDNFNYRKSRCFNKMMTDLQIVDYLINLDESFKVSYYYYQRFIQAIEYKDRNMLESHLDNLSNNLSPRVLQALKSIIENKEYVLNSLDIQYTNGAIEGTNNKIKLLKRVSYGFRSFTNFKLRIMLHFNLIKKHSYNCNSAD